MSKFKSAAIVAASLSVPVILSMNAARANAPADEAADASTIVVTGVVDPLRLTMKSEGASRLGLTAMPFAYAATLPFRMPPRGRPGSSTHRACSALASPRGALPGRIR